MILAVALPVGFTFGIASWALMRGRGKGTGFLLSILFGILGAFVGGLGGQAVGGNTNAAVGVGTVVGALLVSFAGGFAFSGGPKRAAAVGSRAGVAVEQPDHGEPVETVR